MMRGKGEKLWRFQKREEEGLVCKGRRNITLPNGGKGTVGGKGEPLRAGTRPKTEQTHEATQTQFAVNASKSFLDAANF